MVQVGKLTLVETRALRRTSTVFSCEETSSIVLGRLSRQLVVQQIKRISRALTIFRPMAVAVDQWDLLLALLRM